MAKNGHFWPVYVLNADLASFGRPFLCIAVKGALTRAVKQL